MHAWAQALLLQAHLWAPRLAVALGILLVSWAIALAAEQAVRRLARRSRLHRPLVLLFGRAAHGSLIVLGGITALGTLGVDISGIVAGLGLTGFALGFALRDSIANVLAGVLVLVYRPFDVGDRIDVSGLSGRVSNVDLRYTTLEGEGERILVPNSKMLTDPVRVKAPPAA